MLELFLDPVVQGVFWAIIGLVVKTWAPAAIPFLGAAKKLEQELIELHHEAQEQNTDIFKRAIEKGKKEAVKALKKYEGFEVPVVK